MEDCSEDDMDVLCLYFYKSNEKEQTMCSKFVNYLTSFPSNKTTSRILFAGVWDMFSLDNPNVNVSSWHLKSSPLSPIYGNFGQQVLFQDFHNINETIELKVKFLEHLFSEMGGVRDTSSHIAVVFLDGRSLSFEERRTVPHILHQQDTDIKVFIVVLDATLVAQIVHLKDTLLVDYYASIPYKHLLALAMCNQCLEGWWKFVQSGGANLISCYKMFKSDDGSDSKETYSTCVDGEDSNLVTVESRSEMAFLRNKISSYFTDTRNRNLSLDSTITFFIGLYRDSGSVTRRFRWELYQRSVSRPLVVNNWLPGKPSGGFSNGCAVWRFDWSKHRSDVTNISRYEVGVIDGWVDVVDGWVDVVDGWVDIDCGFESSHILCETSMSRVTEDSSLFAIKPATNESFSRALNSGAFINYEGSIVSVSFNMNNNDFLNFLHQINYGLFPLFDCEVGGRNSRYISYSLICDGVPDCSDKRDEDLCWEKGTDKWSYFIKHCIGIYCCDGYCLYPQWVNDGEIDCLVCDSLTGHQYNDESEVLMDSLTEYKSCAFICNFDECIHTSKLNDGHIDCEGEEGPLDETIGKLKTVDSCGNVNGRRVWAPRCVYVIDLYGAILGCRDMSHLENCTDFECPVGYYKCPSTYCIPQHYVMDEKGDCPLGEDEVIDIVGRCKDNFACWGSNICLHPDLVCNGHPDCPYKDDEADCTLTCGAGFRCVSGTVTVSTYNKSVPLGVFPIFASQNRYIDMSGINMLNTYLMDYFMPDKTKVLKLSKCNVEHVYVGDGRIIYFQDLDISYNRIKIMDGRDSLFSETLPIRRLNMSYNRELVSVSFLVLPLLETLDLSHTKLSHINSSFLIEFPVLKHLDLSFTFITSFDKRTFPSVWNLHTLDLRGLTVGSFYKDFFNGLTISQHLYTDSFEMCCPQIRGNNIPYFTCHGPVDAISSCYDLVGANVQRVLLWVVEVLAVVGNVTVIVYRLIWDRSSLTKGYGLFVTNLGISDCIMGVYLFIITGADYYYRDIYVLFDKRWRNSNWCRLAGFLATLSSEASIFFIFLITLDRFLIMKFPFGQVKFSKMGICIALLLSWIIAFLLALTPIVFMFEMNSSNAMCIGLPLTTKPLKGWEFSFGVFIVLNLSFCFIIAYGQRVIFGAMSGNRITRTGTNTSIRRADNILVAKQLSLVALFSFLCWFPIGVIGCLSFTGREISNDVYAWVSVFVLPINSAANPFLYTLPVIVDKWRKFRTGG